MKLTEPPTARASVRSKRFDARGFTIVEVVIASIVLILAISSSLAVIQQGMRAIDTARYKTMAGQILQSQMEKLRMLNYSQLTFGTTPNAGGPVNYSTFSTDVNGLAVSTAQINRFTAAGQPGRFYQSITAHPSLPGVRVITLTATWNGMDGQPHTLSYVSHYVQNGISDFFYNGGL